MNINQFPYFTRVGCKTNKEAAILQQAYFELTEVKKYWDVECKYDNTIDQSYIVAKKSKSDVLSIFVPIPVSTKLNISTMLRYLNICPEIKDKKVYLVICSADTTSVYYEINEGIVESQESHERSETVEEKRQSLTKKLSKHRSLLEQSAMYGLPITLPKGEDPQEGGSSR